jgi:hypothetical protein
MGSVRPGDVVADARPVQSELTPACPNCGAPVTGQYCSNCGQRHSEVRLSLRRILADVLEDQFSLNSALPRTLRALLLKPGFLTNEYLARRIASYIPPFRLYLVSSLLFFLTASLAFSRTPIEVSPEEIARADSAIAAEKREALQRGDTAFSRRRTGISISGAGKDWADSVDINLGSDWLNKIAQRRLQSLAHLPPDQAIRTMVREFLRQAPTAVFLLLPIYALLFKVLYIRKKRYYVEHFVFALHVHAFTFLVFFLIMLFASASGAPQPFAALSTVLPPLLILWLLVYTYIAMKRVYKQGWFITLLKWGTIGFTYMFALVYGMVLALIAAMFAI